MNCSERIAINDYAAASIECHDMVQCGMAWHGSIVNTDSDAENCRCGNEQYYQQSKIHN